MKTASWTLALALLALTACVPSPPPPSSAPQSSTAQPSPFPAAPDPRSFRDCADCPQMVRIPAGAFQMGSLADEPGHGADEGPVHRVTIAKPFALAAFETTNGEYRRFLEATHRKDIEWKMYYRAYTVDSPAPVVSIDPYPVVWVSWQDAQDYAAWLSQKTGQHYRLPTEAEWEYAARAGDAVPITEAESGRTYNADAEPASFGNSLPVDAWAANPFGLHEMTANMPEWVEDCYVNSYASAPADGSAVEGACKQRVVRGTYNIGDKFLRRVANRDWGYAVNRAEGNPTTIRLARDLP